MPANFCLFKICHHRKYSRSDCDIYFQTFLLYFNRNTKTPVTTYRCLYRYVITGVLYKRYIMHFMLCNTYHENRCTNSLATRNIVQNVASAVNPIHHPAFLGGESRKERSKCKNYCKHPAIIFSFAF